MTWQTDPIVGSQQSAAATAPAASVGGWQSDPVVSSPGQTDWHSDPIISKPLKNDPTSVSPDQLQMGNYVSDRYAQEYAPGILKGPQRQQVLQWANQQYAPQGGVQDSQLTPRMASDWLRSTLSPQMQQKTDSRFQSEYGMQRVVTDRDQVATQLAQQFIQQNHADPTDPNVQMAMYQYVHQNLRPHGYAENLPPFTIDPSGLAKTDVGLIHGMFDSAVRQGAEALTAGPEAVGRGFYGAMGQLTRNTEGSDATTNPYLASGQKYNANVEAMHNDVNQALPGSSYGQAHPLYGMVENAVGSVPTMAGLGALGKLGTAGKVAMYGQIAAQEYNQVQPQIYAAAKQAGMDDATASARASGWGLAAAAANTYLMKYGALGQQGGQGQAIKQKLTNALFAGLAQGGVSGGQEVNRQLANYAATGQGGDIEKVLEQAAGGAITGAVASPFLPHHEETNEPNPKRNVGRNDAVPAGAGEVHTGESGPQEPDTGSGSQLSPGVPPAEAAPTGSESQDEQGDKQRLPDLPADPHKMSNNQLRDWAAENGYDQTPIAKERGVSKSQILSELFRQQNASVERPAPTALPDEAKSWDAGKLRKWAGDNGIQIPEIVPREESAAFTGGTPRQQIYDFLQGRPVHPDWTPDETGPIPDRKNPRPLPTRPETAPEQQAPAPLPEPKTPPAQPAKVEAPSPEVASNKPPKTLKEARQRQAPKTPAVEPLAAPEKAAAKPPIQPSPAKEIATPKAAEAPQKASKTVALAPHEADAVDTLVALGEKRPIAHGLVIRSRETHPDAKDTADVTRAALQLRMGHSGVSAKGSNEESRPAARQAPAKETAREKPTATVVREHGGDSGRTAVDEGGADNAGRENGVNGSETRIATQTKDVPARYQAVEADSVIPSHDERTFRKNEKHSGGQMRDYSADKSEQLKVTENSHPQNFDSRFLHSDDPTPVNGPPMVDEHGSAIGGNSRAMVAKRVYADTTSGQRLKADTVAAASKFGIDPKAVEGMKKPVIVRRLAETGMSQDRLAEMSRTLQKGRTQETSSSVDAISRAKVLMKNPRALDSLDSLLGDGSTVREAMGNEAKSRRLAKFLQDAGVLTKQETSQFLTPQGTFTEEGKRLVERTLLGTVVKDPHLFEDVPQQLTNKITGNLASLAYLKTRPGFELDRPLTDALEAYHRFRASGFGTTPDSFQKWLGGGDESSMLLTKDKISDQPEAQSLLKALVNENTAQFKSRMERYAELARSVDPNTPTMFAGSDVEPKQAFDEAFNGESKQSSPGGLFLPDWSEGQDEGDGPTAPPSRIPQGKVNEILAQLGKKNGFNAKIVAPDKLSAGDRDLQRIAARFGVQAHIIAGTDTRKFSGTLPLHGVVPTEGKGRVMFIRQGETGTAAREVLGHELLHSMRQVSPDLYLDLLGALDPDQVSEASKRYLDNLTEGTKQGQGDWNKYHRYLLENPSQLQEEGLAMVVGEAAMNERLWKSLAGEQPTLWDKVKGMISDLFDRIRGVSPRMDAIADAFHEFAGGSEEPANQGGGRDLAHAAFLPDWVKKFVEDDAKPTAENVGRAFKEMGEDVRKTFAPQTAGDKARSAANTMREELVGERAQRDDRAQAALKVARNHFADKDEKYSLDFIDKMERGAKQSNPELQGFADDLRGMLDDRLKQVQAKGRLAQYVQDYFPHIWKDHVKASDLFSRRPLRGDQGFLKKRVLQSVEEGVKGLGLKQLYDNPVDSVLARVHSMDKFITAQNFFEEAKGAKLVRRVRATDKMPDGYAKIEDNIATIYGKPNAKGALSIRGYWIAPQKVADVVNNYLSPGLREKSAIFRGYLGAGNLMNQMQLGLSAFHLGFTSFDAATSKFALGLQKLGTAGFRGEAVKDIAGTIKAPIASLLPNSDASKIIQEWYKPGSSGDQNAARMAEWVKIAGGRVSQGEFYHTDWVKSAMDAYRKGNIAGAVWRAPMAAVEALAKPIMEYAVPRQKLSAFADLADFEVRKLGPAYTHPELREALRKAWDSVDNRMGQLVHDNLFWNRTAKDLAMASTRSLGWNIGTIRELFGGLTDTAVQGGKMVTGRKAEVTSRMAYTAAMPVLAGIVGGTLHYLLTGKGPDELKDYFFPKTGRKDSTGHDIRLSLPTYMRDAYPFASAVTHGDVGKIGTMAAHKLHPLANTLSEMLSNKDYYGTQIRNADDPLVKQLADTAKHAGKAFEPFAIRDSAKFKNPAAFVGVTTAPKAYSQSDAEKLAGELEGRKGHEVRTPQEGARAKARGELADQLREDRTAGQAAVKKALRDGTIQRADLSHIKDLVTHSPLERAVKQLDVNDAMKVWDAATDAEKRKILPLIGPKIGNSKTESPQAKAMLRTKLQADMRRLGINRNTPQREEE